MSEQANQSPEAFSNEQELTAHYPGGKVEYSVVGDKGEQNPVLMVPGFTIGKLVQRDFANSLHELGNREVIFSDQPVIDKDSKKNLSALDLQAEAILAILKQQGLEHQPVDFIAHSFGSLITARAAELAAERGITSFDSKRGSHSVFIAPAGSNENENIFYLGGRFAKFMTKSIPYGRELDPTGGWMKAGTKNFTKNLRKTTKEILVLKEKEQIYKKLGRLGLKPHVLGFASDDLYPHKTIGSTAEKHGEALDGYSVPVDSSGVGAASFEEFKEKTNLTGKDARKAWAHHYRNAGHNDFLFHPKRTVKAILPILEHDHKLKEKNRIVL